MRWQSGKETPGGAGKREMGRVIALPSRVSFAIETGKARPGIASFNRLAASAGLNSSGVAAPILGGYLRPDLWMAPDN